MQLKHVCEEMYREMMCEIKNTCEMGLSPTSHIAYCFKVSVEYWSKLRVHVKTQLFTSEAEEIWFFKSMKPAFTALIEYYTMTYHAELFMPVLKEDDVHAFWKRETDKIRKFYRQHSVFCEYYKSGRTSMDHIYFLRCNIKDYSSSFSKLYDTDEEMITSHGHLATSLLACDMYESFIMEKVKTAA